ncbi:mitochondrial carrier [Trichocladium antarcticum]|uniref:Mitochondrial carrier n=1 Tax=Trichocladium antarcticum TaxID=1450529 RepID=A0AAN6UFZ3_9PEZI|nr:mitochondrial carrier [Trichocladium antarcticum]
MASFARDAHSSRDGENHDRIDHHVAPAPDHDPPSEPVVEITAVQKMLSATSGSLLTAVLATPLDVVRVRLQSQGVSQPRPVDLAKLALSFPNAATFRPSDLGVTACCREVFFANNASEVCVVGGTGSGGPRINMTLPTTTTTTTTTNTNHRFPTITCAVEQTQARTFTSTLDGLRKIARHEGLPALWRGLSPTLLMAIPANIIYFTGYDWLRYSDASPVQRAGAGAEHAPLVAGAAARVLAATAVSPIELFRTRLQATRGLSSSRGGHLADTLGGVREMVARHGYRALWRGLTLTLWRDVPFSGMYWWGYETIRGKLTDARERARGGVGGPLGFGAVEHGGRGGGRGRGGESGENHAETFADSFIAGAASGGFASIVTMPFDVGKTRTQVFRDGGPAAAAAAGKAAARPEETSMARLLWHIFRTEGLPGLFRGVVPRTLRVAPSCAVMISSYEVGKRVFRGANERAALAQGGTGAREL